MSDARAFRRIPRDLWFKYSRGCTCEVCALLELDEDQHMGRVRPIREYSRLWSMGRKVVARLVAEYQQALLEWSSHQPRKRGQDGTTSAPERDHRSPGIVHEIRGGGTGPAPLRGQDGTTTIETRRGGGALQAPPPPDTDTWAPPGELTTAAAQRNAELARIRDELERRMAM